MADNRHARRRVSPRGIPKILDGQEVTREQLEAINLIIRRALLEYPRAPFGRPLEDLLAEAYMMGVHAATEHISDSPDRATMIGWLRTLEPHLDAVICFASDMNEHPPNRVVAEIRAMLAQFPS